MPVLTADGTVGAMVARCPTRASPASSEDAYPLNADPAQEVADASQCTRNEFAYKPDTPNVRIREVRKWRDAWWVPTRNGTERSDDWQMWRVGADAHASLHATAPLLVGLAGNDAAGEFRRDRDPGSATIHPVDGVALLFGFDQDSLYALYPDRPGASVVFHPAIPQLRILDLGSGNVMFWIRNGRKAFVVDLLQTRGAT